MLDSNLKTEERESLSRTEFKSGLAFWSFFLISLMGIHSILASESFLPATRESEAYKLYRKRHGSELSKLVYLIDRYKDTKIQVLYDGAYYDTNTAVKVVRWFLAQNYKNGQTAVEWVHQYATTTIFYGKPVFFKLPDGTLRLARDMLLEDLRSLDEAIKQDSRRR